MHKYNKDLRNENVDGVDNSCPVRKAINNETPKTYWFDIRKKHHLPIKSIKIVAKNETEAISKLPECVTWRWRFGPPTK